MKKLVELLYLIVIVSSCSTRPIVKPISFWVFDLENNQLVNANSDKLKFTNPKLQSYVCLSKEGQRSMLILSKADYAKRVDTKSKLDTNK